MAANTNEVTWLCACLRYCHSEELVLVFHCLNWYYLNNYLGTYHHDKLLFQLRPHKLS